jgi:hypothetical protein
MISTAMHIQRFTAMLLLAAVILPVAFLPDAVGGLRQIARELWESTQ